MPSTAAAIKILMIGPGETVVGGISTLVEALMPILSEQVSLLYLPTVQERPVKESGKVSVQNMRFAISQYARFWQALHRFQPDVIHLHTSQGIAWLKDTIYIFIGKLYHCRIILHLHGGNFDVLYDRSPRFFKWYTRTSMKLADAVIAVSVEWQRRLSHIVPIERVCVFRNCIAIDAPCPTLAGRSTDGVKILFLGVVGASKGVFDLLDAVNRLKSSGCDFSLRIAGGEEKAGDLVKAQARLRELSLEDSCQLVGIVRGARKMDLLDEANLFVLPSYHECLPMALLEALSAGLAVVATPVGGIPEVVKDGYNGFLVAPGDVNALAEKLEVLADNEPLREVMGRRSREIAEQELDVKSYAERLVALYKSLACTGTKYREAY